MRRVMTSGTRKKGTIPFCAQHPQGRRQKGRVPFFLLPLGYGLLGVLLAGCNSDFHNIFNRKTADTGKDKFVKETVTAEMLVDYMNKNSERLKTVTCLDVRLVASKGVTQLLSFQLDGRLAAQQPRDFRLMAKMGPQSAVDLGSNNNEFWYWIRDPGNNPSYQFFCTYKDFQAGNISPKVPLPPFQPEWIMEALGMSDYGPATRYQLVDEGDRLKLVENSKSPRGQPVQKIIVFNRKPAKVPTPQVVSYLLWDPVAKKEICSAQIQSSQLAPISATEAATLPEKMVLNWPEERVKLTLRLINPEANKGVAPEMFVRKSQPGFPSVDLATGTIQGQPTSIQQASGLLKK